MQVDKLTSIKKADRYWQNLLIFEVDFPGGHIRRFHLKSADLAKYRWLFPKSAELGLRFSRGYHPQKIPKALGFSQDQKISNEIF